MSLIIYLIQVTCCLAIFYAFYYCILRKETLFGTNRVYLVTTLGLSIVLPLIKIYIDSLEVDEGVLLAPYVYVGSYVHSFTTDLVVTKSSPFPLDRLIVGIYSFGIAVLAIRLLTALKEIQLIRRYGHQTLIAGHVCILSHKVKSPFSFFNTIYFPQSHSFDAAELKEIVVHEVAHVKGRHTLDVLFMELACVFLWPIPLIYFYRKALKDVHEYVADAEVLKETPWENYAQLLVSQQQGQLQNILSNQLIYSQLKKRLLMMNQKRSGNLAGFKYLGFIPVLLVALVLFSFREKLSPEMESSALINDDIADRVLYLTIGADKKIYFGLKEVPKEELESILRNQMAITNDTLLRVKVGKNNIVSELVTIDSIGQKLNLRTVFETDSTLYFYQDGLAIKMEQDNSEFHIEPSKTFGLIESERKLPLFPGCTNVPMEEQERCSMTKLAQYIQDNMVYPESVKNAGVQGRVVVKFTVGADGLVKDIKVVESIHQDADQVVVKMVNEMNEKVGKWLPAIKEGKSQDAEMHLPVKFALDQSAAEEMPLMYAEELPRFPGCEHIHNLEERTICAQGKMYEFIYTTIEYPEVDRKNGIEGQCIVQFTIGDFGSITDINVVRSPSESMKEEVIRIMKAMAALPEKWIPARQDGQAVAMRFTLPIKFKLQNDEVAKESPVLAPPEEERTTKTVTIVPNPASETITIELMEGTQTIQIFNAAGTLVLSQKVNGNTTAKESIDISALPTGHYAVQLITTTGTATGNFSIVK